MASRIKGITISLDGETKGLQKALSDVDKKSRDLQGELKQVERALKFNPGNLELIAQKQQLLSEAIDATTTRLDRLKSAQSQVEAQFKSGEIGADQFRAFQREVIQTESKLKGLKSQIDKLDDSKAPQNLKKDLDGVQKEAENAEGSISELGAAIGGLVAGGGIAGAVQTALDASSLKTKIDIAFDVSPESLKSVKQAIKTVEAYGVDAETALDGVRRQWALNKDASDESNAAIVKGAATISAAYAGIDFTELIQETNEIASELKITNEEALGLTNSLLKMGFPPEQLDIISEYGQQLQRAGYTTQEIQALFAAGIETGTWNIDNLLDGLKEGRIRAAEFGQEIPPAMEEILQSTDISAEQMQKWGKAVAAGGEGGKKAMQEIAQALQEVDDETTKNALGVAVFGTMYEDQGQNILDTLLNAKNATVDLKANQEQLNASVSKMDADPTVKWNQAMNDMKTAMTPLLGLISDFVGKIAEWAKENPTLTATIVAITTVLGILIGLFIALTPVLYALAGGATALNIGLGPLTLIILGIMAAIAALIAIGVLLYKNWDTIKAFLLSAWTAIKDAAVSVFDWIVEFFKKWGSTILVVLGGPIGWIVALIVKHWDAIKAATIKVWNIIKSAVSNAVNGIKNTMSSIWNSIKSIASSGWSSIKTTIVNGVNSAWQAIKNYVGKFKDTGRDMIRGMIDGVASMAKSLLDKVKNVVGDAVSAAKNLLGIRSPSKVFMEIGEDTGRGLELGLENKLSDIAKISGELASATVFDIPTMNNRMQSMSSGATITVNNYISFDNVVINNDTDLDKLSEQVSQKVTQKTQRLFKTPLGVRI